jgi:two-component system phosphate regulon sensor histidine kinase PhoR
MLVLTFMSDTRAEDDLRSRTLSLGKTLNYFGQDLNHISAHETTLGNIRITIISQSGDVLYDSHAENLENHADRPEIIAAFNYGQGGSKRYSSTLAQQTFYYALRLESGEVLRLSKTTSSAVFTVMSILPLSLLVIVINFIACLILSGRLTRRIIKPINDIDFNKDAEIYEELSPFMRKIKNQEQQIQEQFRALEDKADTIDAIITNMREGILLLDRNQIVLAANKSVSEFIKNNLDCTGKNILEVVRDLDFLDCVKKALSGERCNLTISDDGRATEVFFSPVLSNEKTDGLIILFLDVTEKKNAEKMRREFSANVSHELRTPLTSILGMAEMLDEGMVKKDDTGGFVTAIRNEASRLLELIEDIIRLSELDEGNSGSRISMKEEFDAGLAAREAAERLAGLAAEKEVKIIVEADENCVIKANKSFIEEMLYNLTDNGIKYNKAGGEVKITVSVRKSRVKFIVSDTGIGIEPEHLSRIFERFYRVDKSRSKKTGGTGLGLSIVKHIAEHHGGSVDITSRAGKGTSVTVRI